MKKYVLLAIMSILLTGFSQAQWTTSGTHIYNTNTGYVAVGNTAPTSLPAIS